MKYIIFSNDIDKNILKNTLIDKVPNLKTILKIIRKDLGYYP